MDCRLLWGFNQRFFFLGPHVVRRCPILLFVYSLVQSSTFIRLIKLYIYHLLGFEFGCLWYLLLQYIVSLFQKVTRISNCSVCDLVWLIDHNYNVIHVVSSIPVSVCFIDAGLFNVFFSSCLYCTGSTKVGANKMFALLCYLHLPNCFHLLSASKFESLFIHQRVWSRI